MLQRLDQFPPDDIAASIISFHEQVQGWLAYLNRSRKPEQIVVAYEELEIIWRWFLKMNVTSYTHEAQICFSQIKRQCASKPWTCALRVLRLQRRPRF